tara:strand:+ start:79 stop:468 length:390 start_codon:yes stop_codon:yes gene_type:complete
MQEKYKYDEIKSYFDEWIKEQPKEWILENKDDLHHHSFNTDYYIIGTYQATKWLGDKVFNIIEEIKNYENDNFGEVNTDFSDPEKIVNMYAYIVGEEIVQKYVEEQKLDEQAEKKVNEDYKEHLKETVA